MNGPGASRAGDRASGPARPPGAHLVVGATGATGRLLVAELVARGERVRALVRRAEGLPEALRGDSRVVVIEGSILGLGDAGLATLVDGCGAVASCLGHTLSLRGVFGPPRRSATVERSVARSRPSVFASPNPRSARPGNTE